VLRRLRPPALVVGAAALLAATASPALTHADAATSATTAAATAAAPPPAAPTAVAGDPVALDPASLKLRIDAILAQKPLVGATIGVHAVDLGTGEVLYSRNPDIAQNPASNIKLVTTAAALALLGPEHRYVTRVYAGKKTLRGSTVEGDLYLRGGGDPALITADLYQLASDLRALGITKITGGLVLDTTLFDRDEFPPGFDQKEELVAYRSPGGALSVNFGTFVVLVRPGGSDGAATLAAVDPPVPSLKLENTATTAAGARARLGVAFEPAKEGHGLTIKLSGTIGVDAEPAEYRYPVSHPAEYTGEVFKLVLQQRGIKLGKSTVKLAAIPDDASRLAIVRSQPVSVLVRSVNKLSNNYMAEHILKTLDTATPQTYAGGLRRVHTWLTELGVATAGFSMTNGSGLYDTNRITAAQLTTLLVRVHRDFRIAGDFLASLAIAGADGTMRTRLQDSPAQRFVRAKTGTLDQVSALAGYAGAVGKPPIVFAILVSSLDKWKAGAVKQAQNDIAELLAAAAAARP
jgi:D-alanyl-D-alanine carboxypeptidase/D-alanyl-D-alanine-endopeptidase (penicillin-binding protein 4)